jgi:hypothetical protein
MFLRAQANQPCGSNIFPNVRLFLPILALLTLPAAAQTASPQVAATLDKAATQAEALRQSLPNFTCSVHGHNQDIVKGKVKDAEPFEATIRSLRQPDGQLAESVTFLSVKGKPWREGNHRPYFVQGAFTEVLSYITPPLAACSNFTQQGDRVDFAVPDPFPSGCARVRGLHGYFNVDADGNVTHFERTLPDSDNESDVVPFAAVDLAPVTLDNRTFRLVSHVIGERPFEEVTLRFDADYTDCKLFTTQIKILPGKPVDDNAPPQP